MKNSDILFFAFRYALGRKTYVVSQVSDHIIKHWDEIPTKDQIQMKEEIREAMRMGRSGWLVDQDAWERILELDS